MKQFAISDAHVFVLPTQVSCLVRVPARVEVDNTHLSPVPSKHNTSVRSRLEEAGGIVSTDSGILDVAALVLETNVSSETENEGIFCTRNWTAERKLRRKPKARRSFVDTTFCYKHRQVPTACLASVPFSFRGQYLGASQVLQGTRDVLFVTGSNKYDQA